MYNWVLYQIPFHKKVKMPKNVAYMTFWHSTVDISTTRRIILSHCFAFSGFYPRGAMMQHGIKLSHGVYVCLCLSKVETDKRIELVFVARLRAFTK